MKKILLPIILLTILTSCKVFNPSQMLCTDSNFKYSDFPANQKTVDEYKIVPNDELSFRLFTNRGEKIIDPMSESSTNIGMTSNIGLTYIVEFDGQIKLPVLGRVPISGLTLREAEKMLEEKYVIYYNQPFVQIRVMNNRVIVFPGGQGGNAKVLTLLNANTTLIEAIAQAGGIIDGKAKKIKLIRENSQNSQVYYIDFSTLEGYKKGNIILQANDIIYVDSRDKIPQKILENITPYLSLLSTALLIYGILK